jgi:hypothetical protein
MGRKPLTPRTEKPASRVETAAGRFDPEAPLRLKVAAAVAFPDGSMTASGLRREAARGRLVVERIAGKDYTTLTAIEEMRTKCRRLNNPPICGSGQPGQSAPPSGLSSTSDATSALAAARATTKALKERSKRTSHKSE